MKSSQNIKAIFWDYDGTIVDSRYKNLNVTKKILRHVTRQDPHDFFVLHSVEAYDSALRLAVNWRDFYQKHLGLSSEQIDVAGSLWTKFQINDDTPAFVFNHIPEALAKLSCFPQAIISQNSREIIIKSLNDHGLLPHFNLIVGYEEVEIHNQKPHPDGLLFCIEQLNIKDPGKIYYIGDHETDVEFAENANRVLTSRGSDLNIISIGALYGNMNYKQHWSNQPEFFAHKPLDIIDLVEKILDSD